MINIKHILSLPPDKRDDEIRKLLVPKPWKHELSLKVDHHKDSAEFSLGGHECMKCARVFPLCIGDDQPIHPPTFRYGDDCPIPDPIPLDWNLAMKMRDKCQHMRFWQAMGEVFSYVVAYDKYSCGLNIDMWITTKAQPHHYILAALKAKEIKDE